jgi:hypothetical protein
MNATAAEVRTAAARALYGRTPEEIMRDIRALTAMLVVELDAWDEAVPIAPALTTLETTFEGGRALMRQLRLALQARAEVR